MMIRARLETRRFLFEAYGQTTSHAIKALERGLVAHGREYQLPADWYHAMRDDIQTDHIALCRCYRDSELIKNQGE